MNIYEIVNKLIGEIHPIGETKEDEKRYENLKEAIELIDGLINDIEYVTENKDRRERSMYIAGHYAYNYLKGLAEYLNDKDS